MGSELHGYQLCELCRSCLLLEQLSGAILVRRVLFYAPVRVSSALSSVLASHGFGPKIEFFRTQR